MVAFRSASMLSAVPVLLASVSGLLGAEGLNNRGVARTPVMGFNTWNAFQCNISEDVIWNTAKLMQELGLQAAGYNHFNLDDCYAELNRSSSGRIVADSVRFKSGMKNLTDGLHELGFQTGIYGDSGLATCQGYPGSFGHEAQDAQTFFVDWGFDYLKFDNCAIPDDEVTRQGIVGKYQRMGDVIANLDKPVVFSLCEWGWQQPWVWGKTMAQSWRTTWDLRPTWASVASLLNQNSFWTLATDFYGRNDLDILQVGNGGVMTYEEEKSHFTAWALLKSPLFISTNLSNITSERLEILSNREIIAINQDPVVGESLSPFRWGINPDWVSNASYPAQYWSGNSQNGTVFMLLNTLSETADMFFNLTESPWIRAGRQYSVRDLWAHTDNGTAVRNLTLSGVPPHGVIALLLKDAGNEPAGLYPPVVGWHA